MGAHTASAGRKVHGKPFVRPSRRSGGLQPRRAITLEVTESVLLDDPEATIAVLHRLRALGFRLAVDDFGTGYSSLSYLRQLPVHEVKIDREFVSDLTSSAQGRVIVESVVRMCHALGAQVVAEGVETEAQAAVLRAMGCDVAQGWLFGRPGPEAAARALLGIGVPALGLGSGTQSASSRRRAASSALFRSPSPLATSRLMVNCISPRAV